MLFEVEEDGLRPWTGTLLNGMMVESSPSKSSSWQRWDFNLLSSNTLHSIHEAGKCFLPNRITHTPPPPQLFAERFPSPQ